MYQKHSNMYSTSCISNRGIKNAVQSCTLRSLCLMVKIKSNFAHCYSNFHQYPQLALYVCLKNLMWSMII